MFGADHHNSKEPTLVATSDSNILLIALDNTLCRGDHHLHASKLLTIQIFGLRCCALPTPLYSLRNTPFTLQWVFARRA